MSSIFRVSMGILLYILLWLLVSLLIFMLGIYLFPPSSPEVGTSTSLSIGVLTLLGGWVFTYIPYILLFAFAHCLFLEAILRTELFVNPILASMLLGIICGTVQWLLIVLFLWTGARLYIGLPFFISATCVGYFIGVVYCRILMKF